MLRDNTLFCERNLAMLHRSRNNGVSLSPPEAALSDYDLVVLARSGDHNAFEKLYERYNDRICRYICRMVGSDSLGCELTQDTFSKAWEMLLQLRNPACFASWLYKIATHSVYKYQDRKKQHEMLPLHEYAENMGQLSVAGPELQVEEHELIKLALAHVSKTYRPCLILYCVDELPQRQIAEYLGIKESCVSKYVSRGKQELRLIYLRLSGETARSADRKERRP
jgi:RNA polymerase sigma-70 factor, ECF subfamily